MYGKYIIETYNERNGGGYIKKKHPEGNTYPLGILFF